MSPWQCLLVLAVAHCLKSSDPHGTLQSNSGLSDFNLEYLDEVSGYSSSSYGPFVTDHDDYDISSSLYESILPLMPSPSLLTIAPKPYLSGISMAQKLQHFFVKYNRRTLKPEDFQSIATTITSIIELISTASSSTKARDVLNTDMFQKELARGSRLRKYKESEEFREHTGFWVRLVAMTCGTDCAAYLDRVEHRYEFVALPWSVDEAKKLRRDIQSFSSSPERETRLEFGELEITLDKDAYLASEGDIKITVNPVGTTNFVVLFTVKPDTNSIELDSIEHSKLLPEYPLKVLLELIRVFARSLFPHKLLSTTISLADTAHASCRYLEAGLVIDSGLANSLSPLWVYRYGSTFYTERLGSIHVDIVDEGFGPSSITNYLYTIGARPLSSLGVIDLDSSSTILDWVNRAVPGLSPPFEIQNSLEDCRVANALTLALQKISPRRDYPMAYDLFADSYRQVPRVLFGVHL